MHDLDLGYAPTCGFECYGPKSRLRGIRLFEFREDDPAAYETRMLTWGDLIGRYSSNELRVSRRPLRDRSDRHPQRIAPPAGIRSAVRCHEPRFMAVIRSLVKKR